MTLEACSRFRWKRVFAGTGSELRRKGMSADVVGHKVYLFGGFLWPGTHNDMAMYVVDAKNLFTWKELEVDGDIPTERSNHASWVYNDGIFLHGGRSHQTLEGVCIAKNDLWRYDMALNKFEMITASGKDLKHRRGHSASYVEAIEACIFYGGTSRYDSVIGALRCLNMKTLCCTAPVAKGLSPGCVHDQSTCVVGHTVFMFGGSPSRFKLLSSGRLVTLLHCHPEGYFTWSQPKVLGDFGMPRWRWGATLTRCGSRIFLVGGQTGERYDSRFHFYEWHEQKWYTIQGDQYSPQTSLHICVYVNKKIFACGGRGRNSCSPCVLRPA